MTRVLHVYSGNLYGGVETVLVTLARERARCPALVPAFALCFPGRLADELTAAGAPVHALGPVRLRRSLGVLRARRALATLLRREPFDVVVCHSAWPLAVFGPVVRACDVPLVSWLHDVPDGTHWLDALARRTDVDLVVCNSAYTAAAPRGRLREVPIAVVHCPVSPPDDHRAERAEVRAALDTPADAVAIVVASRLVAGKGHVLLLDALARLRDLPGWVCWVVGGAQRASEHAYAERLREVTAGAGIADRVRFVGQRPDVPRLLAAADVHCQPNTAPDAFGVAFVEALGAGLPVVTTAIGGAREIVDDSCGVLVPPGDAAALAATLARLVGDATLRARLGLGGPRRARTLADPATRLAELEALLSAVSAGGPARAAALATGAP